MSRKTVSDSLNPKPEPEDPAQAHSGRLPATWGLPAPETLFFSGSPAGRPRCGRFARQARLFWRRKGPTMCVQAAAAANSKATRCSQLDALKDPLCCCATSVAAAAASLFNMRLAFFTSNRSRARNILFFQLAHFPTCAAPQSLPVQRRRRSREKSNKTLVVAASVRRAQNARPQIGHKTRSS